MNLQGEPPEKTKSSSPPPSTPPSPPPSFSLLPDEIIVNYLARISRLYYPKLSIVSKSFRSILSSTELYAERSHLGNIEKCLYICYHDRNSQFPNCFRLCVNPNRSKPNSRILTHQIPQFNSTTATNSAVVVGSQIYLIGGPVHGSPSSAVRILDCRSHTWLDAPSMNVAREYAHSRVYDEKIYVLGGCKRLKNDEPWGEVFDTKTQTWERLSDPDTEIRKFEIYSTGEREGKIMFGDFDKLYAYDIKQGTWELREEGRRITSPPKSECVIENVSYQNGSYGCIYWYDANSEFLKEVKGLDSLPGKYKIYGSSSRYSVLVNFSGRLLLMWEEFTRHSTKIWCAEIVMEKRDGGEVWGNVEWVDVVHSVPASCQLLQCLVVSV